MPVFLCNTAHPVPWTAAVSRLRAVWKFPKQMRKWLTSNFRKDTSDCSQRLPNTSQTRAWGSTKGDEGWALTTSQLTLGQCVPKTRESTMCLSHPRMSRFPQLHHTRATDTFLAHTETRWSFIWRSNCKTSTPPRPKIRTSKIVTPLLCRGQDLKLEATVKSAILSQHTQVDCCHPATIGTFSLLLVGRKWTPDNYELKEEAKSCSNVYVGTKDNSKGDSS